MGVSSMITTLNDSVSSNYNWRAAEWSYNPAQAAQQGGVFMRLTYNPDDAGQTAVMMGADYNEGAYIQALWDGYIWMPLTIRASDIYFKSGDNLTETYAAFNGNAGAPATISTGCALLSSSNALSSITAPGGQTADITALPRVATTIGVAAFFGNLGGMFVLQASGWILQNQYGYAPLLAFLAVSYLLALGWIQAWLPRTRTPS